MKLIYVVSPYAGNMERAWEAAKAFNDQHGPQNNIYEYAAAPLEQEEL